MYEPKRRKIRQLKRRKEMTRVRMDAKILKVTKYCPRIEAGETRNKKYFRKIQLRTRTIIYCL